LIYYRLLLIAVMLLALQFGTNKLFQLKNGSGFQTSLLYTVVSSSMAAIISLIVNGFKLNVTPFSFLCALGVSILCVSYSLLGFRIFALGSYAVFTMFLMLGGMLLPFFYGLLFLGDAKESTTISLVCRIVGATLLTFSLVFPVLRKKEEKQDETGKKRSTAVRFLLLCICVFIMNGFVSILSKVHQTSTLPISDTGSFAFLTNAMSSALSGIVLLISIIVKKDRPHLAEGYPVWKLFTTAAVCSLCGTVSYLLQLVVAASPTPASVQYPFLTGGTVVLSAVVGLLFFHEKLDKKTTFGILLSFASTFLFLF